MIRVYFLFEDPFDDDEVNLSYVDVPTANSAQALRRVARAAKSGALWRNLYPDDKEHPYVLIENKMTYIDISPLADQRNDRTTLVT